MDGKIKYRWLFFLAVVVLMVIGFLIIDSKIEKMATQINQFNIYYSQHHNYNIENVNGTGNAIGDNNTVNNQTKNHVEIQDKQPERS